MSGQGISIPSHLLKEIPIERLTALAQKDEEFFTYFSELDLSQVRELQEKRENMNNKNRDLSLENTQLRPIFDEKKERLTNSCLVAAELKESYEKKYKQLKLMTNATDRATLYKELQQAMKKAEKDSEELADNYLDGTTQLSSDEFVNQFLSERSSYWSRRVKSEKMDVIMKQPLPYPPSQPIYATPTQPHAPPIASIPPYPPTSNNEPLPPSYNSLTRGNPTQSVSSSYNEAPPVPGGPRRTSMPIPNSSMPPTASMVPPNASMPGGMPVPSSSWGAGSSSYNPSQQGYPQASYRPSPPLQSSYRPAPPPQASYRPAPPPQASYRPSQPPQASYRSPQPQASYRPPPQGSTVPPAVGHSYNPIYQQAPYYPNQYGGGGRGYNPPPRR